jgi:adenylosuccinate synthase
MAKRLAVLGGQWGDEGKGKIVDVLAKSADLVVRATGGNNAGHSVVVGSRSFKFHLLPSGIIHSQTMNVIGNGTVVNPTALTAEIRGLQGEGFSVSPKNLAISCAAHVITQAHLAEDNPQSSALSKHIGTTGRGIGPAYRDKMIRSGTRMETFVSGSTEEALFLRPYVTNTSWLIHQAMGQNKRILYEGAQGALLDIDHGTYPFVTSSSATIGGVLTGAGVGLSGIDSALGIFKAYSTRVGKGPFVTELGNENTLAEEGTWNEFKKDKEAILQDAIQQANAGNAIHAGKLLRFQGVEYGTTTGRARRCGWFDAVAAKYAVAINGLNAFALTKMDVLQHLNEIKVCTQYRKNGQETALFPPTPSVLEKTEPIYTSFTGWRENIGSLKSFEHLPEAARKYVRGIQDLLGIPCAMISVGPSREQTMVLEKRYLL